MWRTFQTTNLLRSTVRLGHVDDLALFVYSHFMLHPAHAAGLIRVPGLAELGSVGVRGQLDDEAFVVVLAAVLAGVRASDAKRPILGDHGFRLTASAPG